MSLPLMVSTILVAGWNVTLAVAAYLTEMGPFRSEPQEGRRMRRSFEVLRVEVGKPEFDARATAWSREHGQSAVESIHSRVAEISHTVERRVPYAEASVFVEGLQGMELRRCSVCMN